MTTRAKIRTIMQRTQLIKVNVRAKWLWARTWTIVHKKLGKMKVIENEMGEKNTIFAMS
jgi:hypothetical protein